MLFAALLAFTTCSSGAGNVDVLIVERPQRLTIYNQYQQETRQQEMLEFLPFSPFKIIQANDFLGDGFTPCMKTELAGKTFFLGKNDNDVLLGSEKAGSLKLLRSVEALSDTIEILRSNRLTATNSNQSQYQLSKGTRFVRVFRFGGRTYGKLLSSTEQYAWIDFSNGKEDKDWKIGTSSTLSTAEQIKSILPKVLEKVNEVNAKLSKVYAYFSRKSARHIPAPEWQVRQAEDSVVCELKTGISDSAFSQSSHLLGKIVESVTLGTELQVRSSPGRIEIF